MDWLKSILQNLPLEKISDILGEIVIWWSQMVKGVEPNSLPMYAYIGGAIVVLALWILVARMLPKPLGGVSWMVLFSLLFAPGTALSDPSTIAPASISVVYAIMMKDTASAINNALPIMVVLVVCMFIGFVWQLIRGAFETSLEEARRRTAIDTESTMQLVGGNYLSDHIVSLDTKNDETMHTKTVVLEKIEPEPVSNHLTKQIESPKLKPLPPPKKKIQGFYSDKKPKSRSVNRVTAVDNIKNADIKDVENVSIVNVDKQVDK